MSGRRSSIAPRRQKLTRVGRTSSVRSTTRRAIVEPPSADASSDDQSPTSQPPSQPQQPQQTSTTSTTSSSATVFREPLAATSKKRSRLAAAAADRDFGDNRPGRSGPGTIVVLPSTMYHPSILARQKRVRRTELHDVKEAVRKGFRDEVARVEATSERESDAAELTTILVDAAGAALSQFEPIERDLSRHLAAVQTLKVHEEGRRARRTALLAVLEERRRVQMELASVRADLEWTRAQRQRVAALNALSADLQTAHEAGAAVVLLDSDAITDAPSFTTSIESLVALSADHAAAPTSARATAQAMRKFLAAAGDR